MNLIQAAYNYMVTYYSGDPKRINHFIKVHSIAKFLADSENIDENTKNIIELTALMHDIGIKKSEEIYKSSSGKYQELLGPELANTALIAIGCPISYRSRICYIIGHHHTYKNIDDIDYRIIIEADFLVNAYEDKLSTESIKQARDKIFATQSGIALLNKMYFFAD